MLPTEAASHSSSSRSSSIVELASVGSIYLYAPRLYVEDASFVQHPPKPQLVSRRQERVPQLAVWRSCESCRMFFSEMEIDCSRRLRSQSSACQVKAAGLH